MPAFSVEIPQDLSDRIETAFAAEFGYGAPDPPVPAERTAFVYSKVLAYLMNITVDYESRIAADRAADEARVQGIADFSSLIDGIVPADATET